MPSSEPSVRYSIKNETFSDKEKSPPIASTHYQPSHNYVTHTAPAPFVVADYEEFDEEIDRDEVDSEFTPLHNGVDEGMLVPRKGYNPDGPTKPRGYYPQWPSYYPEVRLILSSCSSQMLTKFYF